MAHLPTLAELGEFTGPPGVALGVAAMHLRLSVTGRSVQRLRRTVRRLRRFVLQFAKVSDARVRALELATATSKEQ